MEHRRAFLERSAALLAAGSALRVPLLAAQNGPPAVPAPEGSTLRFFPGFRAFRRQTPGATINGVIGGSGPPLLLLHGSPQTHLEWHKVAPALARRFTVVATDLRGYGDSSKPADGINHDGYSKRSTARDQVDVMKALGFDRFALVGHDRGGRVAHRLALDFPEAVTRVAVLDIVPTYKIFQSVTKEFATVFFHFFMMAQPAPLPETLLGNNAEFMLRNKWFLGLMPAVIPEEVYAEYLRCFKDPATLHAMCEDYRAAITIDLDHDKADLATKVQCPLLALWDVNGGMAAMFDVAATWRERASNVRGKALAGGHYLPEAVPDALIAELLPFLS